jgi:hypothetical protein
MLYARPISITLLDEENGKPIESANLLIGVPLGNKNTKIRLTTDSKGKGAFSFVEELPETFNLVTGPEFEVCNGGVARYKTEEVVNAGVVASCSHLKKFHYSGGVEPGQLVVFGRRVGFLERMRREL